jgi:hypothetical protein
MRRRIWAVAAITAIAVVAIGATVFTYVDAELSKPHFSRGVARLDGYSIGGAPTELTLLFTTGAGDQVEGPAVVE